MKKVYLIFAALTSVALFSCTGDELAENAPVTNPEVEKPIMFSSLNKGMTRADYTGKDAAELLGKQFVVTGYKGTQTTWDDNDNVTVFDNYAVIYKENSAHTTESNVANWEYAGVDRIQHAIDKGITRQSIKYWDYSAAQYDFIAWSTGKKTAIYSGTPSDGQVLVSAITPKTATGPSGVAYTFKGAAAALKDCYIADLVTVKKDQYGAPVTLKFRALGSKVRIGIYETIPGYSVKDVKFYTAADVDLFNENDATDGAANAAKNKKPRLFTTTANKIYTEGTYTVYYPNVDGSSTDNNQAHVSFAGSDPQSTVVEFSDLQYTIAEDGEKTDGKAFLGRTSATASYAGEAEGNYYTQYLPNEAGTNLNLRVDYTLESIDGGGETIKVRGATAQVPSIYTQWKAGYAYTYLFKISDKTNGHTGKYDPLKPDDTTTNSDPAGLYPITFDAMVENAEDNDATQETITLVSTPSITTYQKGSTVINDNEYKAATGDIFVIVSDGNEETTPDLANGKLQDLVGTAKLYLLPATLPRVYTEADVIDAIQVQDDDAATGTIKGRSGLVLTEETMTLSNTIQYGVDGNTIEIPVDGSKKKVAQFTPAAGTYAFVYTKKAPTSTTEKFQAVTKIAGEDVTGFYRFAYAATTPSHYIDENATPTPSDPSDDTPYYDAQKGVKYFSLTGSNYNMETAFIGQTVSNLYIDPVGAIIASGYAKSGSTYYYTNDHGTTYKAAHNVNYADFAGATLYKFDGTTYTAKPATETTPVDGTAYYFQESDGVTYTYCVILPQQVKTWYVLDETADKEACSATEVAIDGQTYFDKYTQNNGVYYTKVIKVQ